MLHCHLPRWNISRGWKIKRFQRRFFFLFFSLKNSSYYKRKCNHALCKKKKIILTFNVKGLSLKSRFRKLKKKMNQVQTSFHRQESRCHRDGPSCFLSDVVQERVLVIGQEGVRYPDFLGKRSCESHGCDGRVILQALHQRTVVNELKPFVSPVLV